MDNRKVGILFQPKSAAAVDLGQHLAQVVSDLGVDVWLCSSWDEKRAKEEAERTELLICLGGDGTILRAARIVNAMAIPILGVNMGRLGFMAELRSEDALSRVPDFLMGHGWIDERAMLQAEIVSANTPVFHALNDVVVARGERCRLIRINATIDGELVTTYKCDGVILATATGSTGYSLAAGGPILHPLASDILLQPVAAHLSSGTALVLPYDVEVKLELSTTHQATLSIDGQIEVPLEDGAVVKIKRSPHVTRLLRSGWPAHFYGTLMQRMANGGGNSI
ncbi:MAG: NAD(+)/NADH kinase [Chloroflexota bacterium]|nr:NAD(+)/NADH kinase [Chloroflexota bacterium]